MNRRRVLALAAPLAMIGTLGIAKAQESTPANCDDAIGRFTPSGAEFHGTGNTVSDAIPFKKGIVIAEVTMGAAGAVKLVSAAGDFVLLSNSTDPVDHAQALEQIDAGNHYLGVEFFSDISDWSVKLEQPKA